MLKKFNSKKESYMRHSYIRIVLYFIITKIVPLQLRVRKNQVKNNKKGRLCFYYYVIMKKKSNCINIF